MKYRPLSERDVEDPVVKHARKRGCLVRKMNGLGARSWPDRMFLGPKGRVLWIEFKKPGEQPTPLQAELHKQMEKLDHSVEIVDNVEVGRSLVDSLFSP